MSATSIWIWDLLVIVINDEGFNTTRRFACPSSWGWTNCLRESFPHWLQLPEDLALRSVAVQHRDLLPIAMAYQSQGYGSNGGSNSALPVILCGAIRYLEPCSHVAIYQVYQLQFLESPICTSCRCSWRACRKVAEAEVTRSSQLTLSTRFSATTRPTTLIRSKCGKKNCFDPKTQLQTVSSWISCFLATEVTDALRLTSQGLKFSSGYPAEGGWVAGGMWCASREMSWEALLKAVALYVWVSCGIRLEHSLEHDSSILSMTKYGSSGIGQVSQ